jgi:cytochrome c
MEKKMKMLAFAAAALALLVQSGQVQASADLAKAKNCMGCHAIDKKVLGPAFKEVAAKYKGQKDVAAVLAGKIQKGSNGGWGPIAMPPNPVSDAEAKSLAQWVMSQ